VLPSELLMRRLGRHFTAHCSKAQADPETAVAAPAETNLLA
jgi:hypothetical protein